MWQEEAREEFLTETAAKDAEIAITKAENAKLSEQLANMQANG